MSPRDWLAVRIYRLAGRVYALAARIEPAKPRCPDCGFEERGDTCDVCDEARERDRMLGEAYEDGANDAARDIHREAGLL